MKRFGMGRVRYLEGEMADWHTSGGYVFVKIGGQALCLLESQLNGRFKSRSPIRVMLRDPADGEGVSEVLAWQRLGDQRIHYQGMRVSVGIVLFGAVLALLGLFTGMEPLILPGALILLVQAALGVRKWWIVHSFESRFHGKPSAAPSVDTNAGPPGVPLEVSLKATSAQSAPRAANWPSEILEFTHDAIIIWEMDGAGIVYWNRAAEQLYGFTREQAYGRVTHELLKTQLAGGVGELESRIARYGIWVGELCHTCSDGRRVEVEGRLSLMSQEHRPWLVLEVNRDVTDRNRAESARRAMEKQLARLRARSPD
jgi:PAS domain S-box-containing protein